MSSERVRNDAAWLEQELDVMAPEVIREAYPERKYGRMFAREAGLSPGAKSITYKMAKAVGQAKIVDPGSREVPLVQYDVTPITASMYLIVLGMEYDTEDVREGQLTGRPLDRDQYVEVQEGHESKIDEISFIGDPVRKLHGLVSHPNILRLITSTTFDSNSTPAQILAAIILMAVKMVSLTNGVEKANTFACDEESFQYIASTSYSQAGSGDVRTILQVAQAALPGIDLWEPVFHLSTAGVGSAAVAVMYNRARTKIAHLLAMVPTRNPIAFDGRNYRAVVESKTGGVQVKKPFSVIVLEGIG